MAQSRSEKIHAIVLAHQRRTDQMYDFDYEECSCGVPDVTRLDRGARLRMRTAFRWQAHFDEVWAREIEPLLKG
jgi:hypothetical protein